MLRIRDALLTLSDADLQQVNDLVDPTCILVTSCGEDVDVGSMAAPLNFGHPW